MLLQYGSYFRTIRHNKGLTLAEVSRNITSPSFLSKFERNEASMSIDILLPLLDNMNVKLDEFAVTANIKSSKNFYAQLTKITGYQIKNDIEKLVGIKNFEMNQYETTHVLFHKHLSIISRAAIADDTDTKLAKSSISYIVNYLFGIEHWNEYELTIFSSIVAQLTSDVQRRLSFELFKQLQEPRIITKNLNLIWSSVINVIIAQIDRKNYADANILVSQLEQENSPNVDWQIRIRLTFLKGVLIFCTFKNEQGIETAEKAIDAMKLIGETELARQHREYLDAIVLK